MSPGKDTGWVLDPPKEQKPSLFHPNVLDRQWLVAGTFQGYSTQSLFQSLMRSRPSRPRVVMMLHSHPKQLFTPKLVSPWVIKGHPITKKHR